MKLLIDIGNTRLKWACWQQGHLGMQHSVAHQGLSLENLCQQQWGGLAVPDEGIFVSSVANPQYTDILSQFCQQQWQRTPHFIQSTANACGVQNAYAEPHRLGVDRWLAMIGAWFWTQQKSCCIVDCGTAITVDAINASGQHQGGLILPGIAKMHHILARDTHALGQYHRDPPPLLASDPLLADNSQLAIQLGIYYAVVGLIEHVLSGLQTDTPLVLMTGGAAPLLMPSMPPICHYVPDLVLRGLLQVSETK